MDLKHYAISQTGSRHISRSIPCEDRSTAGTINVNEDTIYGYAIVCDGVSAAEKGGEGAGLASEAFEKTLQAELSAGTLPEEAMKAAMADAYIALCEAADEEELPLPAFATTLCAALLAPGNTLYCAQAGDSGCVAYFMDGSCSMVTHRHNGEEKNIVHPLHEADEWEFTKAENVCSAVCLTDGLLDQWVLYEHDEAVYFPGVAAALLGTGPELEDEVMDWEALLSAEGEGTIRETVDDDLSIAVIRDEEAVSAADEPKWSSDGWKALMDEIAAEEEQRAAADRAERMKRAEEGHLRREENRRKAAERRKKSAPADTEERAAEEAIPLPPVTLGTAAQDLVEDTVLLAGDFITLAGTAFTALNDHFRDIVDQIGGDDHG